MSDLITDEMVEAAAVVLRNQLRERLIAAKALRDAAEMLRPHCPTSAQDLDTRADRIERGES